MTEEFREIFTGFVSASTLHKEEDPLLKLRKQKSELQIEMKTAECDTNFKRANIAISKIQERIDAFKKKCESKGVEYERL